ncbi:hypothetical protein [Celeribacter sp.]|uniref:hypothetical protein n=1 Tax=Celeribacter sp. TaxID=1890673 RepID=UPI003A92F238
MMKRDTFYLVLVVFLVVAPATFMLALHYATHNPSYRPLGITLEKLLEAGQIADKTLIVTEVTFGPNAESNLSLDDYRTAFDKSFGIFNTETRVEFRNAKSGRDIIIRYKVGNSVIGPFPISRAAEGIRAAVEAERMVTKQRAILAQKEQSNEQEQGFWARILSE